MNKISRRMVAAIISSLVLMFSVTSCSLVNFLLGNVDVPTTEEEFLSTFELDGDADTLELEVIYDDYSEGLGDGTAMYKITVTDELKSQVEEWDELPLSDEANELVQSLHDYIILPKIKNGNWKMVDREPEAESLAEVSLAIYDADNAIIYFIKRDL